MPAVLPQASVPAQPAEVAALSQDQYRLLLIDAAGRIKKRMPYPRVARENNWEGQVGLRVQVSTSGRAAVTLRGSSGYEELDRHGLHMYSQAAREVPVPQSLRGKEFVVDVRAIYGLTD
jgi:TonB family protein